MINAIKFRIRMFERLIRLSEQEKAESQTDFEKGVYAGQIQGFKRAIEELQGLLITAEMLDKADKEEVA